MSEIEAWGISAREIGETVSAAFARGNQIVQTEQQDEAVLVPDPGVHVRQEANGTVHLFYPDPAANRRMVKRLCQLFDVPFPKSIA